MEVTRLDERTLRVRPGQGFCATEGERMVRGLSRPFRPGDEIRLSDLRVIVSRVSARRRALEAEFHFGRPLEDPSFLWVSWQGTGLVPYDPPPVGSTKVLPALTLSSPRSSVTAAPAR